MCEVRPNKNTVSWYHLIFNLSVQLYMTRYYWWKNYHPHCYKFWQKFKILTEIQVLGTLLYTHTHIHFHHLLYPELGSISNFTECAFQQLENTNNHRTTSQCTLPYCHLKLVQYHPWIKIIHSHPCYKVHISLELLWINYNDFNNY
jgi:hypothetical protein